jgi:hypothetical protein
MKLEQMNQLPAFDLLSQDAQQRLRARITAANGDIPAVAGEIRAQLDALDKQSGDHSEAHSDSQADRAFYVAQLTYLDRLAQAERQTGMKQQHGWLARIQTMLRHPQSAK